jgi:hypothetical protein
MIATALGRPVGSLRGRLLLLVSIVTLIIWIAAAAFSYRQARHEVRELMDSQMAQSAALLLSQAAHGPEDLTNLAAEMAQLRGVKKRRNELTLEFRCGRPATGAVGPRPGADPDAGARLRRHRA